MSDKKGREKCSLRLMQREGLTQKGEQAESKKNIFVNQLYLKHNVMLEGFESSCTLRAKIVRKQTLLSLKT